MDLFYNIILLLAGIGVLLYGVRTLNQGLEGVLSVGFKRSLNKTASNKIKGYGLGAGITTLVQSSTLTIAMVAGFVNVSTISLGQGLTIILGANLGSALATVLLAFESVNIIKICTIFCLIAAFLFLISKKNSLQKVATTLMGFGLLCLGLTLIGTSMTVIVSEPSINTFLATLTNPFILLLVGAVICFVTDSTYATIAIIVALVGVTGGGPIDVQSGFYMLLGACFVGGYSTLVYNISGASIDAKRALWFHVLFKMFAGLIFALLSLIPWIEPFWHLLGEQTGLTFVLIYCAMMLIPGLILLPFTNLLAKLMRKIVPQKAKDTSVYDQFIPDENSVKIFSLAYPWVVSRINDIIRMESDLAEKLVMRLSTKDAEERGLQGKIKALDKIIKLMTNNIIRISSNKSEGNIEKTNILLGIINDISHVLEKINKLYTLGTTYKQKPRSMTVSEAEKLFPLWIEIRELSELLNAFVDNLKDMDSRAKNKALREIFQVSDRNAKSNNKAKEQLFREYKKKKVYSDNSMYLSILLSLENMNSDISNIAIKFGILENE